MILQFKQTSKPLHQRNSYVICDKLRPDCFKPLSSDSVLKPYQNERVTVSCGAWLQPQFILNIALADFSYLINADFLTTDCGFEQCK